MMREIRVTPPLALRLNRGRDGNNGGTCESGSRREVSSVVETELAGTGKAAETRGSLRVTSSLPEGSEDSVEDCGAEQAVSAEGRDDRNAVTACGNEGTDRSGE